MKKLATVFLSIALILSTFAFPATAHAAANWASTVSYDASSTFDGGTGTSGDPYIIASETALAQLAVNVNDATSPLDYSGVYFRLNTDLDLGGAFWTPIGTWVWGSLVGCNPFSGSFNGMGNDGIYHTISNMTVNDTTKIGVGLFGYIKGAAIEGIGLINCDVTGQALAGGLVGLVEENSSIISCYTIGTVKVVYTGSGAGYDGRCAGGLVGMCGKDTETLSSTIEACWSSALVDGDRIGGLVGYSCLANITDSHATGNIGSPTGAYSAGGFIGQCDQTVIERCYATGNVTGTGNDGGFIGDTYSNGDNNRFTNCYARGNVTCTYDYGWSTGGFGGAIEDADFYNCYSTGYVSFTASTGEGYYIGGFFGGTYYGNVMFTNCFVDTQAAGREAAGNGDDATSAAYPNITGLSTANMQGGDTLINPAKMDTLDSGAGASVWYAHSSDYPDFQAEFCTVTYDSQGADTAASPGIENGVLLGSTVTLPSPDPVKAGCTFGGWWTAVNGGGTQFTASTPVTGNMTVYAKWTKTSSASIYVDGRATLTATGSGGGWSYDPTYLELTDNGDGTATIRGIRAGTTDVTYMSNGLNEIFTITITTSGLPSTGQDGTMMFILGGAGLLALAGAVLMRKYKHAR